MTVDVSSLGVSELRARIKSAGLEYSDCIEKSELRQRCLEALSTMRARREQAREYGLPVHFQVPGADGGADRYVDLHVKDSSIIPSVVYEGGDCSICLEPLVPSAKWQWQWQWRR